MEVWSVWLCVMAFLVISLTNWIYWWRNPKCDGKLPPGSMGLPFIGETLSFFVTSKSMDIHPFVKERMKRYGPFFKTSLAGRQIVVSSDPDFNHFVLQQEGKLVDIYYMDSFSNLVVKNNNEGGYVHKYLRRVTLNHFGSEPLKNKLLSQIENTINLALHEWTKQPEIETKTQFSAMLVGVASKILMSHEIGKSKEYLAQSLCSMLDGLMRFPLYIPGTTFYRCMKSRQKILRMVSELVEERRKSYNSQGRNKGDFLDQIVEDMQNEEFLTKEFVNNLMFVVLLATVDSISSTTTFAIKYLLDNPSVLQQLEEEHEEILKRREGTNPGISWEEYKSMTFTHYVINETLRLTSVAPGILRRVKTDIQVNGYTIPKGWILLVVPAAVQLNPNKYEDPLTFNPSRWKNIEGIAMAKNFLAFGGGNRSCAGAEYSKVVMAVFLHVWVTKFRLTRIKGGDVVRTPILKFSNGLYIKVSDK